MPWKPGKTRALPETSSRGVLKDVEAGATTRIRWTAGGVDAYEGSDAGELMHRTRAPKHQTPGPVEAVAGAVGGPEVDGQIIGGEINGRRRLHGRVGMSDRLGFIQAGTDIKKIESLHELTAVSLMRQLPGR